ncbi:hypothetical protein [Shewanella sp. WE21]|nr:hypothetical protein [Shewanella sp. WE21]
MAATRTNSKISNDIIHHSSFIIEALEKIREEKLLVAPEVF